MKIVLSAFESAVDDLHNDKPLSEADRVTLARTVIEFAEHGMRCPTQLRDAALARFARAA